MSGHNPHGRLGQPNPPWNHLQVPSFIPRQPQLAHMSNEPRPMNVRSSPLAWHTPAHTEAALYNYMAAATHKTPLDMNPLLPAFVRPPNNTPFGSVDLSLGGTSSRNNSNASPRTVSASPANPIESNFGNLSASQTNEMNHQQIPRNGEQRGPTPSSISTIPPAGQFGQPFTANDMPHMMHNNFHPLHDSLQLVKEAIHNSLRQQAVEQDLQDLHELQTAISAKTKSPTTSNFNSEPERAPPTQQRTTQVNSVALNSPLPPPPLTPTNPPALSTTAHARSSPSSALHHSTSSCSSSSSRSSSSSASSGQHEANQSMDNTTQSLDDKSQTRRRSRKPSKTTRMSNNSEVGDEVPPNNGPKCTNVSADYSEDVQSNANPPKVHENGTSQSSWKDAAPNVTQSTTSPITAASTTTAANRKTTPATLPADLSTNQEQQHPERRKSTTPTTQHPALNEDTETIDNIAAELAKSSHENGATTPQEPSKPVNADTFLLTPVSVSLRPVSLADLQATTLLQRSASSTANTTSQPTTNGVDAKPHDPAPKVNGIAPLKSTPNDAPRSEALFEEVENKLEEMFAGIEDDRPLFEVSARASTPSKAESPSTSNKCASAPKKTSTPKVVVEAASAATTLQKKKRGKPPGKRTTATPAKAGKGKKANTRKSNAMKKLAAKQDKMGKSTKEAAKEEAPKPVAVVRIGPIVHVDHSGATHVINGQIPEEVTEVKAKLKKGFIVGHQHPAGHASDRSKIRGLHVSTLSTKYDADTTDTTWMCVFCKMGPHRMGLGDLFGPYIVSTACEEFQLSQSDPMGDLFVGQGHQKRPGEQVQRRSLPVAAAASSVPKKKRKTNEPPLLSSPPQSPAASSATNPSPFHGMARASDTSFEVWMHGDCAVWSSGVHIIGTRIVGLEAAVWAASGHRCVVCLQYGAMLSCLQRGCADEVHVPCARLAWWTLSDDDFKSRCSKHSIKVEPTASTSYSSSANAS